MVDPELADRVSCLLGLGDCANALKSRRNWEPSFDYAASVRRIQSGQASETMARSIGNLDPRQALTLFADWTDRIAAGELPKFHPPRPQGQERNVVITMWDWANP